VIVAILRVFQKIDQKIKFNGFDVQKTIEPSKNHGLYSRNEIQTHSWFRLDDDFRRSADPGNGFNQYICLHDGRGVSLNLQFGVQNFKLYADQR
jgi:hypothetical protein